MEKCRPSSKSGFGEANGLPKLKFKAKLNRVRFGVICDECKKGRLLFSEKKLSELEKTTLEDALDSQPFVCGYLLFEDDHELNSKIFQLESNNCAKPMTALYFSALKRNVKGCQKICSVCQNDCEYAVEDNHFKGLPRCKGCQSEKKIIQHRFQKIQTV